MVVPLDTEAERACHASAAAARTLLNTIPTTAAGLAALRTLIRDHQPLAEFLSMDDEVLDLIDTMATAAANLAAA